ncbi:DUF6265 family protein [Phenylobacterium sp.]|jgi:hypothetical protein|uniref:DUF6265 family protein n=1 Tax=Phenylobacterium sp. TaxID=1871053 RepID=UPI002E380A3F|nr:DUF6265 family protein [Phenylobacterium sp.]HEX2559027.1 DUF6265 family protein [Phenylobacterium sp.]
MIIAAIAAAALCASDADVAAFEWMSGTWIAEKPGGAIVRETWTTSNGRAMTGVGQTVRAGKPAFTEFMTITAEPAGITFTAYVDGQDPTPFVLRPGGEGAVFENLAHDFPQRVIYRPCGADLCARIEGQVKGELKSEDWRLRRVGPPNGALPPEK